MNSSPVTNPAPPGGVFSDVLAGAVVFLIALPLCLGVALASGAPPFAGLLAGIVGGIVIGVLSGSHTSVSGPSPASVVVVTGLLASLGSFEAFLLAVTLAGLIQIGLGLVRAGFIAAFFPTSVIQGLLAAVGVILVLKQIPHVVGHDPDPEGDMSFEQPDHQNTFSELREIIFDLHPGAAVIGLLSIAVLVLWERSRRLKASPFPAPLVVVGLGVGLNLLFGRLGGWWAIEESHLVQVPVAESVAGFFGLLKLPDFSQWANPAIYKAAVMIAIVATLETLLNLEAVDRLDPRQRVSPPNRELLAQGAGNALGGLIGALPITSVIVRSSVNINAGARSKWSTVVHGVFLLTSAMLLPTYVNMIPISCLAAILLVTGFKLASPKVVRNMLAGGKSQFVPFAVTLVAIVLTDLLVGIVIGLCVAVTFILYSNLRRPIRRTVEKHLGGDVLRIDLPNQVSFLNKAALENVLREVPAGGHVLIDASQTDYVDPDILDLVREFKEHTGPVHGVEVSLRGFRRRYHLRDDVRHVDFSTRELQDALTPDQVVQIFKDGNERFRTGRALRRDFNAAVDATAGGQHPLAVVLSCIDSRSPAEIIFDLGLGDIFSVRVAGNISSRKVLGSIEYGTAVVGAKLVLVLGHTRCGAVGAAVDSVCTDIEATTICPHLDPILGEIRQSVDEAMCRQAKHFSGQEMEAFRNVVARRNVERVVRQIETESRPVRELSEAGRIKVVGALYDVTSGRIEFLSDAERLSPPEPDDRRRAGLAADVAAS